MNVIKVASVVVLVAAIGAVAYSVALRTPAKKPNAQWRPPAARPASDLPAAQAPRVEPSDFGATEAAKLAARLANEKCQSFWGEEPFTAEAYKAALDGERWRWGRYDPAGIAGYSAEVSFTAGGRDPKVEVYWSTDADVDWTDEEEEDEDVDERVDLAE